MGAGIGAAFGAICPVGAFGAAIGSGLAGGAAWFSGGSDSQIATAYSAGGMVGGLAGGFYNGAKALENATLRSRLGAGLIAVGPDLLGGGIGAIGGYWAEGSSTGALHGAFLGMMVGSAAGGLAKGAWGTRRAVIADGVAPNNSGGWIRRPEGTRLKPVGNYWIKEVDPVASAIQRWWGRGSLNAQARALEKLGDMAPSHLFKNGRLVMRDAGSFSGTTGDVWRIWAKGSHRMGTPFNDIRRRNIGSAGQIFDPAFHPIQEGVYWTGAGVVVVGGGTWVYYEIQANE